jgi:hypothetical protein
MSGVEKRASDAERERVVVRLRDTGAARSSSGKAAER